MQSLKSVVSRCCLSWGANTVSFIQSLKSVMSRYLLVLSILFFMSSCGLIGSKVESSGLDLKQFRDVAFSKLIQKLSDSTVVNYRYKKFNTFIHVGPMQGFMISLMADNVDRSFVVFRFDGEQKETTCGLYIREKPDKSVFASLTRCKGPQSIGLSNRSIIIPLSEIQ